MSKLVPEDLMMEARNCWEVSNASLIENKRLLPQVAILNDKNEVFMLMGVFDGEVDSKERFSARAKLTALAVGGKRVSFFSEAWSLDLGSDDETRQSRYDEYRAWRDSGHEEDGLEHAPYAIEVVTVHVEDLDGTALALFNIIREDGQPRLAPFDPEKVHYTLHGDSQVEGRFSRFLASRAVALDGDAQKRAQMAMKLLGMELVSFSSPEDLKDLPPENMDSARDTSFTPPEKSGTVH